MVRVMVFHDTFNNISAISWRSVLLLKKTGVPEKTTNLSQVTNKIYHIMLYQVHLTNEWDSKSKLQCDMHRLL